ncbi:MAG: hypothetical protein QNJ47_19785 [Nostocaceae cyanobacterium]|nr:hypothetical protein [Nostocaceae cyanobacterium]
MENESKSDNIPPIPRKTGQGRLLIGRSQRRIFLLAFTLMTILGWIVGGFASIFLETALLARVPEFWAQQPQMWETQVRFVSSGVFAILFATFQGLVIRRYLSFWLWMVATSAGWVIFTIVGETWKNNIISFAQSRSLSANDLVNWGILSTLAYNFAAVWLGLCQWLVLRRYKVAAWWWIFLPSIIFCIISVFVWLLALFVELIPENYRTQILYFSGQSFTVLMLGVIPGIALCNLRSHLHSHQRISKSSSTGGMDRS